MKLFKISLAWQMALATTLGILVGLAFGDYCDLFAPLTSAYVMILKITTIPYLFIAIIHGIGQLQTSQALQILKNGLIFITIAWLINIAMIYSSICLFPEADGIANTHYSASQPAEINFAKMLIPENIFYSLSNNIVPSVVVFSLLIGISLMHIREKVSLMRILDALVDALSNITRWISRITPLGTFLIIAYQVGTVQLSTVKQVSTYIIVYLLIISLTLFWIFPRLISALTTVRAYRWLKDLSPILILAYTTNVVIVSLPFIIELIKRELERFVSTDDKTQSQIQGIVSVTFNLPLGSLFITIFIFFISIFYGNLPSFSGQIQLLCNSFIVSLGSVGLGSILNALSFTLSSMGLPHDAVTIFLTTLPFTAGFQTMLSVIEIASLSFLITLSCHRLIKWKWTRLLRKTLVTVVPIIVLFLLIRHYNPLPKVQDCTPDIREIPVPSASISKEGIAVPRNSDLLSEILQTKTLRVGFDPNRPPFCFKNQWDQLSGYDMAFARELGRDLGCKLLFVPMQSDRLISQLESGELDIAMSAIALTESQLTSLYFTAPYLESQIVFIGKKREQKRLSKTEAIEATTTLKIAALEGSVFEQLAREHFPNHCILTITNYNQYPDIGADLLLWSEAEAIDWLGRNRSYTLISPDPGLGNVLFCYAIPSHAHSFLNYLNLWLILKKNEGFADNQYNLWILGKTQSIAAEEPRWSILHNVLHWLD